MPSKRFAKIAKELKYPEKSIYEILESRVEMGLPVGGFNCPILRLQKIDGKKCDNKAKSIYGY